MKVGDLAWFSKHLSSVPNIWGSDEARFRSFVHSVGSPCSRCLPGGMVGVTWGKERSPSLLARMPWLGLVYFLSNKLRSEARIENGAQLYFPIKARPNISHKKLHSLLNSELGGKHR